jgi:hypothetical protein
MNEYINHFNFDLVSRELGIRRTYFAVMRHEVREAGNSKPSRLMPSNYTQILTGIASTFTFERLEPRPKEDYIEWYEGNGSLRTPDGYIQDLARLGNLTHLYFKYIPSLDRAFGVQLNVQLPNLPHLNTLCLLPLPGSKDERHKLELPTLECLQTLSSANLALQHLTISLDM